MKKYNYQLQAYLFVIVSLKSITNFSELEHQKLLINACSKNIKSNELGEMG